jgi:dTDP-4-dehydrorhamnose reductase/mannose-6-phosphate isomerase-like protein (cupin superfamily)
MTRGVLLLRAGGPMARGLARGLSEAGAAEVVLDETTPLSSMREVRKRVVDAQPEAVLVAGGFDDASLAESDPDRAFRENAEEMIHVAAAALELGIPPILISTAEVFGQRGGPFSESDEPSPASTWARSRLMGETFLCRASKDALIVRAGPILSEGLEAEHARLLAGPIEEASDEQVTPIRAAELGAAIQALIAAKKRGVFHVASGEPPVSRAELWTAIAGALGFGPERVVSRPGREIARGAAAARSPALFADKIAAVLARPPGPWRAALGSNPAARSDGEVKMGHRQEVRRVDKPWGHEVIWAQTDRYVGKVLFIRAGERLSLQYHEKKDETVYVMSGKMVFEVGPKDGPREDLVMKAGDSFHITPYTVHRMIAIEDTHVLEASTTELNDVVRLEDKYGRAGTSNP